MWRPGDMGSGVRKTSVWDRLYTAETFNNVCKSLCMHKKDGLDMALEADYNHAQTFGASKAQVYVQPQTITRKTSDLDEEFILKNTQQITETVRKENINFKKNVDSPHLPQTNAGFSRKPCGGFYKY